MFPSCQYIQTDMEGYNWKKPLLNNNALHLWNTIFFNMLSDTLSHVIFKATQWGKVGVFMHYLTDEETVTSQYRLNIQ